MRAAAFLAVALLLGLAAPAQAQAQGQHHVTIEQYAYSPATLTVRVGDTVTWTNHDQAAHDVVTTSAPAAFQSPLLSTGQSWSQTFTVPGTYAYYCSVHPDMRAQVVVLATETPAPAPEAPAPTENAPPPPPTTTVTAPTTTTVPATTATPAPQTPQTTQAAVTTTFDPMLVVAGLVAAVTILCLLLMGARPEK
jgi:plastocyanin